MVFVVGCGPSGVQECSEGERSGLRAAACSRKVPFALTIFQFCAKACSNRLAGMWPFAEARCRKNHSARRRTGSSDPRSRMARDRRDEICCASSGASALHNITAHTALRKPRRCSRHTLAKLKKAPPAPPTPPTRSDKNHHPAAGVIVTKNSRAWGLFVGYLER